MAFRPRDNAGTAVAERSNPREADRGYDYDVGVLAGLEWSPAENAELDDREKVVLKELKAKAEKRDYPARLIEVIQAWEAALFYRGFQFLIPQRGGGWIIPGESTGYGPTMQMDLALLPTNVYSARAQMIIAALTRTVPNVRFAPQNAANDADITAADSADKFIKVIKRNNDLIMVQNDAARYLWTDGRFLYWSRFVRDGQKFGWQEEDEPDDIIPENEAAAEGMDKIEKAAADQTANEAEGSASSEAQGSVESQEETTPTGAENPDISEEGEEPAEAATTKRTPLGQEVRSAHGKLEHKCVPMMANDMCDMDAVILEYEVDLGRARGMFPWVANAIKGGDRGTTESEISRLARQNVKLGMQSTYVTSDSFADDVTVQRIWMRPAYFMHAPENEREGLIEKFPNGCLAVYAGDVFCYARNESMDDSLSIGQAYAGDGQNRNAMGTSTLPLQKRLNNWLDLMNDLFVRAVPKKWMDSKAFNIDALRQQTNIPGDIGGFKRQGNTPVSELIFVEPQVTLPAPLTDFITKYAGDLAELCSGAYPALAGGDTGTADSGVAIATQRDSALGRLAPTWHAIKNCEASSMKQLVTWGAKCRNNSIREKIPGGEVIELEVNDLKGNILAFAESDENFPETYTQRKNNITQMFESVAKNPQMAEALYNPDNMELLTEASGLQGRGLYIEEVESRNKQLGEIEILCKQKAVLKPEFIQAEQKIAAIEQAIDSGGGDISQVEQAKAQLEATPEEQRYDTSLPIDKEIDDHAVEKWTCQKFLRSPQGRKLKVSSHLKWLNVKLHMMLHDAAATEQQAAAAAAVPGKPPSKSINYKDVVQTDSGAAAEMLAEGGLHPAQASPAPGAGAPAPVPPTSAGPAKGPAAPIAAGTPEFAGGAPKK